MVVSLSPSMVMVPLLKVNFMKHTTSPNCGTYQQSLFAKTINTVWVLQLTGKGFEGIVSSSRKLGTINCCVKIRIKTLCFNRILQARRISSRYACWWYGCYCCSWSNQVRQRICLEEWTNYDWVEDLQIPRSLNVWSRHILQNSWWGQSKKSEKEIILVTHFLSFLENKYFFW